MKKGFVIVAIAALLGGTAGPVGAQVNGTNGVWMNPHNSVAVKTGPCGDKLCGWIVWASPEAMTDAKDAGVSRLIGTELLQDYRRENDGSYAGTVFVPDMGRSFSSTISLEGTSALKVKGCLIGGFICKSQVWQRVEKVPNA